MSTSFFDTAEGRALQALPQILGRLTKPFEAPGEINRLAQKMAGQQAQPPVTTEAEKLAKEQDQRAKEMEERAAEAQRRTQEAEQAGQQQRGQAQSGALGAQEQTLKILQQLLQQSIDPKILQQRADIDAALYDRQVRAANQAAMEQTRELTQRAVEKETINAWSAITQKQIDRDTQLAVGMMNLSATLGMPNPNVLAGMAASSRTGAASFSPVKALY